MENKLIPYSAVDSVGSGTILVIAPHADDEVFGCGGAIAKHVLAGDKVHAVVVTDGAAQFRSGESIGKYTALRKAESVEASRELGYSEITFWNYPDRGAMYGEKLVIELAHKIGELGADIIYAPSIQEVHPDHRGIAMAAVEALRRSRDGIKLAMYEIGTPIVPNTLVDITSVFEKKLRAMECFKSQLQVQMYSEHITGLNRYRSYTLPPYIKYAEAYYVIDSESLKNGISTLYMPEYKKQNILGFHFDIAECPLVTVIVRSMDRPTLDDSLNSIALQTYPNIEILVVSAVGPTHRSMKEWCGRFPLRFIETRRSLNRGEAANIGLDKAEGRYVIFLDDDDLFEPEHISSLVNVYNEKPSNRVVYSGARVRDERTNLEEYERESMNGLRFGRSYSAALLQVTNYIPNNTVMFERSIIDSQVRFDESMNVYEDWDFLLLLSSKTAFSYSDRETAIYRITDQSGIGVRPEALIDKEEVLKKFFLKWKDKWSNDQYFDVIRLAANANNGEYANSVEFLDHERLMLQVKKWDLATTTIDSTLNRVIEGLEDTNRSLQMLEARIDRVEHTILEANSRRICMWLHSLADKLKKVFGRVNI